MREYSKRYEEEDLRLKLSQRGDLLSQRVARYAECEEFLKAKAAQYAAERAQRIELRGGAESDAESAYTLVEEEEQEVLSFKEEITHHAEIEIGDD